MLAPESPLVQQLAAGNDEVLSYARIAAARPTEERAAREKSGVFTGKYAINPVNGAELPIWVADYVLMEYGTGAIMAVPAHDTRDLEFAEQYDLPVVPVIDGDETLINSAQFDGMPSQQARRAIVDWLQGQGKAEPTIHYRLRDWSFSRQRYWGCPIPVVYCERDGLVPLPEDQLPLLLPDVAEYRPKGKPPLASNPEFMNTICPRCAARPCAKRTRWTPSSTRPGTSSAIRTRTTTTRRSTARWPTTGCPSISTSAASTTRRATCSTRGSSSRR